VWQQKNERKIMTNPITLTGTETATYTLVDINIEGGTCDPADLKSFLCPFFTVNGAKGVILNGRAPIWVFGTLIHHFHATAWVATNDPRQGGAVVVESHKSGVAVGDIIPLS
jgi:CRISPR-associated protein Csx3